MHDASGIGLALILASDEIAESAHFISRGRAIRTDVAYNAEFLRLRAEALRLDAHFGATGGSSAFVSTPQEHEDLRDRQALRKRAFESAK